MSGTHKRPRRIMRRLTLPHNWDTASREILSRGEVSTEIPAPGPDCDPAVRKTLTRLKALRLEPCNEVIK